LRTWFGKVSYVSRVQEIWKRDSFLKKVFTDKFSFFESFFEDSNL